MGGREIVMDGFSEIKSNKIKDLPNGIRQLAELRHEQYLDPDMIYKHSTPSIFSIMWENTPEGEDFWHEVSLGNFSVYNGCKVTNLVWKQKIKEEEMK